MVVLAWFLRLAMGPPAGSPEKILRRTERQLLRPPGELVEIIENRFNYATAVTWLDGELYTYALCPVDDDTTKTWSHRYTFGVPYRDTVHDSPWGCCTFTVVRHESYNLKTVMELSFNVLVRITDPRVRSGKLTVETTSEGYSKTWKAAAERTNPYYLAFTLKLWGGSDVMKDHFYAMHSCSDDVTAEAEAVFYDEEGNEVSRMRFSMPGFPEEERSGENGA
jgi:hypothetical protein